jgi:hypothetical protein
VSDTCCSHGLQQPKKEVPTFEEFAPRFLDGYARANREKPSGIAAKEVLMVAMPGKHMNAFSTPTESTHCITCCERSVN